MYLPLNNEKALFYKNEIINNYPESRYAKIILNPKEMVEEDNSDSPESVYATIFYEYKEEKFESVIKQTTTAINKYQDLTIVSKFELLKAYAIGKKDGLIAFKEALDFVVVNYPNTEEGKKALEVLQAIETKL
jgi:outer membrane protein assembly factor BamD (BamD/ComL family)